MPDVPGRDLLVAHRQGLLFNRRDVTGIEFRDEFIYEELAKPFEARAVPMVQIPCDGSARCPRRPDASGAALTY